MTPGCTNRLGKFFVLIVVLGSGLELQAATDTFLINALVGFDSVPPTVPANVVTTPVATDEITVTWDASTDNFSVSGYQIWRDAALLATTTATTYNDTGLSASTTYAYRIRAFDPASNFSTFSTTTSTTTLPVVVTSTPTTVSAATSSSVSSTRVGADQITIDNYQVTTFERRAVITFTTNVPVAAALRWGRTVDYELGYSAQGVLRTEHRLVLTDLQPATIYELELQLQGARRRTTVVQTDTFTTARVLDGIAPPNVMNFTAVPGAEGVSLTWDVPNVADYSHVRIMSSDIFYPFNPADGYVVFEGDASTAFDDRAFMSGVRYYTAFVYDEAGNMSSGAVTLVTGIVTDGVDITQTPTLPPDTFATETTLPFGLIEFRQDSRLSPNTAGWPRLYAGAATAISIPYEALPEHLKTIVVTLTHPDDATRTFSFLLKVNADKTNYEAVIGALVTTGWYVTEIEIFDFKTKTFTRATGTVEVVPSNRSSSSRSDVETVSAWRWAWLALFALLLAIILMRRARNQLE